MADPQPSVEAVEAAIHDLATTIGRARVFLDAESLTDREADALSELKTAADALGRLRQALPAIYADLRERFLAELEKKRQWAVHGVNAPGDPMSEREQLNGVSVVEVAGVNAALDKAMKGGGQ